MKNFTSAEIKACVSKANFDEKIILRKDSSWPRISIVTPSFNQGKFLERTILSVLNQNYPNLEYILMDGGSADGSVDIIKKYERYLTYWVSEKDEGQADAIKKGFRKSTGEILAWLNSDDIYLPGTLHRIARIFQKSVDADVVYSNEYLINEEDGIIGERRLTPCIPHISTSGFLYGGFWVYQPAAFWKRELYYDVGELDGVFHLSMDNDLFVRFALAGARFKFVREFSTGFRVHSGSKTVNLKHIARSEMQAIKSKYCKNSNKLFELFYPAFIRTIRTIFHIVQGDTGYLVKKIF